MPKLRYTYYCDESGTHSNPFYFGAIRLSNACEERLKAKIALWLREREVTEIKYTKLRRHNLEEYKQFIDILFNEKGNAFYYAEVLKDKQWSEFGRDNNDRYYRAFAYFVNRLHGDSRIIKLYASNSGKYLVNKKFWWRVNSKRPRSARFPSTEININSEKEPLIWMCDLLLGALTSQPTAQHKLDFNAHVQSGTEKRERQCGFLHYLGEVI